VSGGINIERKSKWVHSCGVIKQVFEVISSTSTQVVYRDIDGYGQSTIHPFDFLQTFKPKPDVDDTFNAGKKVYGPIQLRTSEWFMGPYEEKPSTLMRLIGIAGQARAGKDTLCSYMLDNLDGIWLRSSFADPLKEMLRAIGVDCSDDKKAVVSDDYGVTPRHMMQTLGTEWGRHMIDGDIWVKAFARLNAGKCVIVPDVRFENEAELVREHGILIHLVGRGGIEGKHVSENAIEFKPGDIVIDNSRDLDWLHAQVDSNAVLGEFVSAE